MTIALLDLHLTAIGVGRRKCSNMTARNTGLGKTMKHQDTGRTPDASREEIDLTVIAFSPNSKACSLFCLM